MDWIDCLLSTRMILDNRANNIDSLLLIYLRDLESLAYQHHFLALQVLSLIPSVKYHSPMPMMAVMVVAMVSFPPLLSLVFLTPTIFLYSRCHISPTICLMYI